MVEALPSLVGHAQAASDRTVTRRANAGVVIVPRSVLKHELNDWKLEQDRPESIRKGAAGVIVVGENETAATGQIDLSEGDV